MTQDGAVAAFVRRLDGRYRVWGGARAALAHALPLAVACCVAELLWPREAIWLWAVTALWVAGVFAWHGLRGHVSVADADRQLGLQDRLLTWSDLRRPRDEAPAAAFAAWLESDLRLALASVPAEDTKRVYRRPLGALRYLVPLLIVLLLLRMFAPLPPNTPAPSGASLSASGDGGGDGEGGGGGGGGDGDQPQDRPQDQPEPQPEEQEPEPEPDEQPDEQDPPQDPPPDPPPSPDPDQGASEALPPTPLLERDPVDVFVAPDFIGEGETRRDLARLALVEVGPAGAPQPTPTPPSAAPEPDRPDPEVEFERARERALRARHVPEPERPFVARYFAELAEGRGK